MPVDKWESPREYQRSVIGEWTRIERISAFLDLGSSSLKELYSNCPDGLITENIFSTII